MSDPVRIIEATEEHASAIRALRIAAANQLTALHGRGHWSSCPTEAGQIRAIRSSSAVLLALSGSSAVGTLRLAKKKPWAIDPSYFSRSSRPLYLHDLAVAPAMQSQGVGRSLVAAAKQVAISLNADAVRLDAYDSPAGAGAFYLRCGFSEVGRVVYRGVPLIYFETVPGP